MGRTSLMLIIAFNVTFMMMGFRLSTASSKAYEKYCGYADVEQAGLAMESCANIAISYALLDTARIAIITRCSNQQLFGKVGTSFTVTQYPKFDAVGVQCGESLQVIGNYALAGAEITDPPMKDTTYVVVTGNSFSQYVFYSQIEGTIYWTTGDTCRGKLHTQDKILVNGDADFKGYVTTKLGVTVSGGAHPNFEKGYTKADISLPKDLLDLNKFGATSNGGRFIDGLNTYVEFLPDGKVIVRTGSWTETSAAMNVSPNTTIPKCTTYASVQALATSGVLLVQDAELHVKGVLNGVGTIPGAITLGCVDKVAGSLKSSVWIDSSVVYKDPPPCSRNPNLVTNDMLGIVASNNISVSQYLNHTSTTPLTDVTIHGSMFSQTGSFGAENYSGRGASGKLTIVGGIQQKTRGAVGTGNPVTNGFHKDYDWDNNLQFRAPKGYPITKFVIQNWVDHTTIPDFFFTR